MPDNIIVAQPLGFPAPYVALVENQTECYGNPVFLYEATSESAGSVSVFGYGDTSSCGVGYRYESCNHAHAMAVVYPPAAQPHTSVSFGGTCWALDGSVSDLRPYRTVGVADVMPVASCVDVICTGSNPFGASVLYMDQEEKTPVTVQFHHLDQGIPAFGVARESFSTGYASTPPGRMAYTIWDARSLPILTASEMCQVAIKIDPIDITRELVLQRAGQRSRIAMPPGYSSRTVDLQPGDALSLEFGNNLRRYRGKSGEVSWEKIVPIPRIYDEAVLTFSGSQAITAIGFTGLTNRQDYIFYGALPASAQLDLPNPDTIVTVQDDLLPEMELIRAQAVSEPNLTFSRPLYAGQKLSSPVVFRFYAGRSRAGQHGEMDVWLEQDQGFPAYLKVSSYKVLTYGDYSYRKSASAEDTTRRGLRVASSTEAGLLKLPRVYADDRGERISASASEEYVFLNGQPYVFTGTLDAGISDTVYSGLEELGNPRHVRQYSIGSTPHGIVYVPATDEIWAATSTGIAIVAANGSPGVTLIASNANFDICWCAATGEVFVARLDGTIVGYNPNTRTTTKSGSIGSPSGFSIRLCARGGAIYVATNMPNATLFALSAQDLVDHGTASTGNAVLVEGCIYLSAVDKVLLGTESGGCWLLDPDSGAFYSANVPSTTARGFCEAPDRKSYYVASASFPGAVREMDPVARSFLNLIPTTYPARNPFWHPLRKKIYYGQYVNGMEEIRDPNGNLLSYVYVGEWSYATAYAPNWRLVFVTLPGINAIVAMT